jgi:hypothetical protein
VATTTSLGLVLPMSVALIVIFMILVSCLLNASLPLGRSCWV